MIPKFKNIIVLLMVLILFMPSIVKLGHHHEHFFCNAKNEKHFHTLHEQCAVCSFEYSVFLPEKINVTTAKIQLADNYTSCLYRYHFSDRSKYSFLLRGPPLNIID